MDSSTTVVLVHGECECMVSSTTVVFVNGKCECMARSTTVVLVHGEYYYCSIRAWKA